MTTTETTNTERLPRQGAFVRVARFAHRRRWLARTLLPALLGTFARHVERRKARGKADDGAAWRRLAAAVQCRPLARLLPEVEL
jgi:putative drug exporter of the RND superfamily